MKWFRSHIKQGSRLALFALAIQFALSFGHFHGVAAEAAAAIQSGATQSDASPANGLAAPEAAEVRAQWFIPERTEPAHREAFVALPVGPAGISAVHFQPAAESLEAWKQEQGIEDERLTLKPEDLGLRITYLATGPVTGTSVPDDYGDFAVPFA